MTALAGYGERIPDFPELIEVRSGRYRIIADYEQIFEQFRKDANLPFTEEQTGYEKTILSDLQGAWIVLRETVVDTEGFEEYELSCHEIEKKLSIIWFYETQRHELLEYFSKGWHIVHKEVIRSVGERDYTQKPSRYMFYEEHGKKRTSEGKYARVLTFDDNFLWLVESLK